MRDAQVVGSSVAAMLSLRTIGSGPSLASRATERNALIFASVRSIAARQASTYSRGETCARASVKGRSRTSLTDHLRHDEKSILPVRRIRGHRFAVERRTRLVVAHRRRLIGGALF